MIFSRHILAIGAWIGIAQAAMALTREQLFLPQLVDESAWILRVRILDTETPFADDNSIIRMALCQVVSIPKASEDSQPILDVSSPPLTDELRKIIVLYPRPPFGYLTKNQECIIFSKHAAIAPWVSGDPTIYPIRRGMVSAFSADFPAPGLSKEDIRDLKNDSPLERKQVSVERFLLRIQELMKGDQSGPRD